MPEYVVAHVDEMKPGDRKIVQAGRVSIGLFRVGDSFYALPNACPHQAGPLCEGKIGGALIATRDTDWRPDLYFEEEVIACPWHGLEFRITTGECIAYPDVRLRQFRVEVEGNDVKIVR